MPYFGFPCCPVPIPLSPPFPVNWVLFREYYPPGEGIRKWSVGRLKPASFCREGEKMRRGTNPLLFSFDPILSFSGNVIFHLELGAIGFGRVIAGSEPEIVRGAVVVIVDLEGNSKLGSTGFVDVTLP